MATSDASDDVICEVCVEDNHVVSATAICRPCQEFYCQDCVRKHKIFRATRSHQIIFFQGNPQDALGGDVACEVCENPVVVNICSVCKQVYCVQCSTMHKKITTTKSHKLLIISVADTSSASIDELEKASDFEECSNLQYSRLNQAQTPVTKTRMEIKVAPQKSDKQNTADFNVYSDNRIVTWEELTEFPIKLDDESHCFVTGITMLPNGKIVIIDHDNNRMKVFSSDYRLLFKREKIGNSFGVISLKDEQVAVLNSEKIEFYDLSQTHDPKLDKVFVTKAFAKAVTRCPNRIGIVYKAKTPQGIQVFDESGNTIADMAITEVNGEKVTLCSNIMFNKDTNGDQVFVEAELPSRDNCILSYTLEGQFLWKSSVAGGIMSLAFSKGHLLVFCGHGHVLRVSPRDGSQKTIAKTKHSISNLKIDEKNGKLFCDSIIHWDKIKVLEYK